MKIFFATLFALSALSFSSLLYAIELQPEQFEALCTRAKQMGDTKEGKEYEKLFSQAFAEPLKAALLTCTKDSKPPFQLKVVFAIGADGTTQRIFHPTEQPIATCVATKLNQLKLPAPPKAGWMVAVKIEIKE